MNVITASVMKCNFCGTHGQNYKHGTKKKKLKNDNYQNKPPHSEQTLMLKKKCPDTFLNALSASHKCIIDKPM